MEQYISKSAVVAELERQRKIYMYDVDNKHSFGRMIECNDLLVFLDSLEVKEVDLDLEIALWANAIPEIRLDDVERFAKYFYELGLKTQKGE